MARRRPNEGHRVLGLEVSRYFTQNPKFKFVDFAGLGRHGGALILSEMSDSDPGVEVRKLVIKYSYGASAVDDDPNADADADLRNEYYWLKKLRGAEHIVQLVPMADCSLMIPGTSDGEDSYAQSVQNQRENERAAADAASGEEQPRAPPPRRCPTFALEYLPWGTLLRFIKRLDDDGVTWLPSRLLWRIWLCMVRQCVAMAFPPDIPDDQYVQGQVTREVIKDQPFFQLTQNSSHFNNFLFSDPVIPGDEHEPKLPVLKLIDFGRGREVYSRGGYQNPSSQYASRINLQMATYPFMQLCCLHAPQGSSFDLLDDQIPYTYQDASGVVREVESAAPHVLRDNPVIDPELRHLIVRVTSYEYAVFPSLRQVLLETEAAIVSKDPDDPGLVTEAARAMEVSETDETIQNIIQKYVYDASS